VTAPTFAPADPLAPAPIVFPSDRYTETVRTLDEAREGLPCIYQLTADATAAIPETVRSACLEAASVAALAYTRVQGVLRQRNELQGNQTLSAFGRQAAIVPVVDRARKDLEKAGARLIEARALAKTLMKSTPRAADQITELRYQEIRRAFAELPREQRYSTLAGAATAASEQGDGDEAELLNAVLSAPAIVLRSMLPGVDETNLAELRRASAPQRYAGAEWCEFVTEMSERAIALAEGWLEQTRSAFGAPVANPSRY